MAPRSLAALPRHIHSLHHAPQLRQHGDLATIAHGQEVANANLALQCALHDVLEDTRVRYEQVRDEFGEAVAQGVLALTVDKRLPRSEQMAECLPRIRQQPAEIWMVKLADRITNLQPPPRHWSKARIRD